MQYVFTTTDQLEAFIEGSVTKAVEKVAVLMNPKIISIIRDHINSMQQQQDVAKYIIKLVSEAFNVSVDDMAMKYSRRQTLPIVEAKQAACYFLTKYTEISVVDIAEMLGYPSKQIVMYGRCQTERIMLVDADLFTNIDNIEMLLRIGKI
jgi:chromosomal replication initiation ATPase DnaA